MSRIARDSPGMGQNVPRLGQGLSGAMQRPGINFSRTKYVVVFGVLLFKKLESKNIPASLINIQHTLNRPYKSRTFYSVEQLLRYGLPKVPMFVKAYRVVTLCRK